MRLVCPECGGQEFSIRYIRLVEETCTFELLGTTPFPTTRAEEIVCSDLEDDGNLKCKDCGVYLPETELITEEKYNESEDNDDGYDD